MSISAESTIVPSTENAPTPSPVGSPTKKKEKGKGKGGGRKRILSRSSKRVSSLKSLIKEEDSEHTLSPETVVDTDGSQTESIGSQDVHT